MRVSISFYEQLFYPEHALHDVGKAQKLSCRIAHPVTAICRRVAAGGTAIVQMLLHPRLHHQQRQAEQERNQLQEHPLEGMENQAAYHP